MRVLFKLGLLTVMLVVTVMALPIVPPNIPANIDPARIGPEASELDLPEFDAARQNTLRRAYNRKRVALVEELIEQFPQQQPTMEAYAEKSRQLKKYLSREKKKLRQRQKSAFKKIVEGELSDENLKVRLKHRQKDLKKAIAREGAYRKKLEMWSERHDDLNRVQKKGWWKGTQAAKRKTQRYQETTQLWERTRGELTQEIQWLEEQLRQIEIKKRTKEDEDADGLADGRRDAIADDTKTPDSQESNNSENEFSLSENLGQQAGKFIGDHFGPWIQRTGDIIHKQQSKGLPQSGNAPGRFPGGMGMRVGGILAH